MSTVPGPAARPSTPSNWAARTPPEILTARPFGLSSRTASLGNCDVARDLDDCGRRGRGTDLDDGEARPARRRRSAVEVARPGPGRLRISAPLGGDGAESPTAFVALTVNGTQASRRVEPQDIARQRRRPRRGHVDDTHRPTGRRGDGVRVTGAMACGTAAHDTRTTPAYGITVGVVGAAGTERLLPLLEIVTGGVVDDGSELPTALVARTVKVTLALGSDRTTHVGRPLVAHVCPLEAVTT